MSNTRKSDVTVTELPQRLADCLARMKTVTEIEVTSHGKVIARIVAGGDPQQEARERLLAVRKHCRVGDVLSPAGAEWEAER